MVFFTVQHDVVNVNAVKYRPWWHNGRMAWQFLCQPPQEIYEGKPIMAVQWRVYMAEFWPSNKFHHLPLMIKLYIFINDTKTEVSIEFSDDEYVIQPN